MTAPHDEVIDYLREKLQEQPWYHRFSNTVTAGVGAVVLLVWLLTSSGVDLPDGVEKGIAAAISLLTVLGVRATKNGTTPREIADIEQYVGRHRME